MFEQFSVYPEIKWLATAAPQFIGPDDKIQINPDLKNFKLERFKDLRNHPEGKEPKYFKLMLKGSSKTNIFIDGPDSQIDILLTKLPSYVGKFWSEINKMRLERSRLTCKNFLIDKRCSPWIVEKFMFNEYGPGKRISYPATEDEIKADKTCLECDNFEDKDGKDY